MRRLLSRSIPLLAVAPLLAAATADEGPTLTIGSKAPSIDIEHWITDREGKVKPFLDFEAGKVYVVEFFATTCPPCVQSMPHLADLQKARAEEGVTVVSVSTEDLATMNAFLKQPTGAGDATYADVAQGYCLTTDPDGSVHNDYMRAAGKNTIPTAFLVGKTGQIEWIGHPMELDEPLGAVVAGTWDRAAYLERIQEQEAMQRKVAAVSELLQAGKGAEALATIDALIAEVDDPAAKRRLRPIRVQVALLAGAPTAMAALNSLLEREDVSTEELDEAAWIAFVMKAQGAPLPNDVLTVATSVAEKAVKLSPESASSLDTLAHLVALGGDVPKAITIQRQAVEHAAAQERPQYEAFLKELEANEGERK